MKKHLSQALSIALSAVLVSGLMPVASYAESETEEPALEAASLLEPQATLTSGWTQCGTCEWQVVNGVLTVRPLGGSGTGTLDSWTNISDSPWYYNQDITSVKFEKGVSAATCIGMFSDCRSLTTVDFTNLDTSAVEDMSYLFQNCTSLTSFNLEKLDTSNVHFIDSMFSFCSSLTSVDMSGISFKLVFKASGVFMYCKNLTTVDLSNWDAPNLWNVASMFSHCTALTSVNLGNISKWEDINYLFDNCSSLTSLDLSGLTVSNSLKFGGAFENCTALTSLTLPAGTNLNGACLPEAPWTDEYNTNYSTTAAMLADNQARTSGAKTYLVRTPSEGWTTCGSCQWKVENGVLTVMPLPGLTEGTLANWSESPWANNTSIQSAVFTSGVSALTCYDMFAGCTSLTTLDFSNLDTSQVTSMSNMFAGCSSLTTPNLYGLITTQVANMSGMFSGCTAMTSVDLAPLSTSLVTNMNGMFSGCAALTSINLEPLSTLLVTDMSYLFSHCDALTSIDVSGFFFSSSTNISDMFAACPALESITLPAQTDFQGAGLNESLWTDGQETILDTTADMLADNLARTSGAFTYYATAVDANWTRSNTCEWFIDEDGQLTIQPISHLTKGTLENWEFSPWSENTSIKTVAIRGNVAAQLCYGMFEDCTSLTSVSFGGFDTSNVTNMNNMFFGCTSLQTIDFSSLDTSKVTNMGYLLSDCESLTRAIFGKINTSQVTDMGGLFSGCSSLLSVDLTYFDFSQVVDTEYLFFDCPKLSIITLPAQVDLPECGLHEDVWQDSQKNSYGTTAAMLAANKARTSGAEEYRVQTPTEGWTQSGSCEWTIDKNGQLIIRPMEGLTEGTLGTWTESPWLNDTSISTVTVEDGVSATTCYHMFKGCSWATSMDLSGLNTAGVTNMEGMFEGCIFLLNLDLASLDTSEVTNMTGMFKNCTALGTITVSNEFTTDKVTASTGMFTGCSQLAGQAGTHYSAACTNKDYARIDAAGTPGYFTEHKHVLVKTEEVPATYDAPGTKAYWTCSTCEKSFSDEACTLAIADLDTWKAVGGEGYIAPLPSIVATATACTSVPFVGVKTAEGTQNLYKVSAAVTFLREGYTPLLGTTPLVKDGSSYSVLVDQATAEAVAAGTLTITAATGTATSVATITGDVNMNGHLNIVDAQVAYDMSTCGYTLGVNVSMEQLLSADVNGDGTVTASDAFAIQYAAFHA